jgi:hypothetical protein
MLTHAAFTYGWSSNSSDGISDGDSAAATDTTLTDATAPLYPVTHAATFFSEDAWPVLENLFASGTGKRYSEVTIQEFVRYHAMLEKAYCNLLSIISVNKLAYHYDWSKVFPFQGAVPDLLYQLAYNLDATDVGLATRWLPLMKRMEHRVMFPRILADAKRSLTPMLSIDLNGRLLWPSYRELMTTLADNVEAEVTSLLDYIQANLGDASSLFTSFLPFPLSQMDPWSMPDEPVIDIDRESGWFNSACQPIPVFNDTGDPDSTKAMMLSDGLNGIQPLIYSRHTQPIWSEVKWCSIWELIPDIDDKFRLVTPHRAYTVIIPDDAFDYITYESTSYADSSTNARYEDYANCRFSQGVQDYGKQKPGLLGASMAGEAIVRMARLQSDYDWNVGVIKAVTAEMTGSSIRELRFGIKELVGNALSLGL